jgi:hypothetical protein
MLRKLIYCLFFIFVISQSVISQENNFDFSVVYSKDYFYYGETMVITIDSNNIIESAEIRIELYWQKNLENDIFISKYDAKINITQNQIIIILPIDRWGEYFLDRLFNGKNSFDEYFKVKIYFNDILISEKDEFLVMCSRVHP